MYASTAPLGTAATDTVVAGVTKTACLGRGLPTVIARGHWLALRQGNARSCLEVSQDRHGKVLLLFELRRDEISEPLGLAEMLKELAEVGQIVTDFLALAAHAELHRLRGS